jgi:hypothetical protein
VTKSRTVYVAVSALLSVLLIAFLLSRVKTADIAQTLKKIYIPALLVYIGVSLLATWLRAWRYKWLLQPHSISWPNMFLVTFIRNSFIDLLPARIGSLSYIYVLNKRLGFSFESAASTFVVSGVLDLLTLGPLVVLAVLLVGFGTAGISVPVWLALAAVYFLGFFVLLWKIVPIGRLAVGAYRTLLKAIKADRNEKAIRSVEALRATVVQLEAIRSRRIFVPMFFLSLAIRLGKYLSLFALLFALLRSHGLGLPDLSFWKTILGITGAEMTSLLPVKGLAGFGTWESAWVLAFRLMAYDTRLALLSGIGIHLITNLWEYGLGFLSLLILIVPYLKKSRTDRRSTTAPGK